MGGGGDFKLTEKVLVGKKLDSDKMKLFCVFQNLVLVKHSHQYV